MTVDTLYTVPPGVPIPATGRVVLLDREPRSVVERSKSLGVARLEGVRLIGIPDDLELLGALPSSVSFVIEISPADAPRLARHRRTLRRLRARVAIRAEAGLFRATNISTALGLTVHLLPYDTTATTPDELMKIARLYLLSPHVRVAIEPLHTITMGRILGFDGQDLFDLYRERVDTDVFLASSTSAALSSRWVHAPEGGVHPLDELEDSSVYGGLRSPVRPLEESCADCPSKQLCGGYLTTCRGGCSEGWKAMFEHLVMAADEIRSTDTVDPAREATLLVSTRCNNRCLFCAPGDGDREVSRDEILDFLRNAARSGVRELSLSGAGEPTLVPELAEYVSVARRSGIDRVTVFTNGTNPNLVTGLVEAGTTGFLLSIHGFETTHDEVVGRAGRFQKAQETLAAIERTATPITINTVLTRRVLPEVGAFCEWTADRSVWRHHLAFPEWSGRALSNPTDLPTYAEVHEALAGLCWGSMRHVRFDNLPDCVVDTGFHKRDNQGLVLYFDHRGPSRLAKALNLGHNARVDFCRDLGCGKFGSCPGVDRRYLAHHGQEDLERIARRWLTHTRSGHG